VWRPRTVKVKIWLSPAWPPPFAIPEGQDICVTRGKSCAEIVMRPSIVRNTVASERDVSTGTWCDDERAARYDSAGNGHFYRTLLARLVSGAGPSSRGLGLDLGCGSGFATEGLLQAFPGVAWQGVDVSAPMLARAARKPTLAAVPLRHAAAEALPYAPGSFDVVVCNFAWHWFGPAAGHEVLRVLRPGGWMLVSAPLRHLSRAEGNRWLARRLHARRRGFRRLASQGLRIEEMTSLLPGDLRTRRLESVVIEETFPDASALLATLESRGSLHAIFGTDEWEPFTETPAGGLAFEWHVGLLHAQAGP
jgi:SAM-dependent methyltransferase